MNNVFMNDSAIQRVLHSHEIMVGARILVCLPSSSYLLKMFHDECVSVKKKSISYSFS